MTPLRDGVRLAACVLRRTANALDTAAKTQTWVMQHPRRDMVENVDERHYAAQYLHWLEPLIAGLPAGARVLDLGCGHGRLALEVAAKRPDCHITGVDLSPPSVAGAKSHAASRSLVNCQFLERDLAEYLPGVEADSIDLVLFVEVSFFAARDLGVLPHVARILRRGGHVFGAFRSQWFNLLHAIVARDLESGRMARDVRDGRLWDGGHRYWWHTPTDIERELTVAGLTQVGPCRGVGVLSGLEGDTGLPQPSSFDAPDQAALLDLELSLAEAYAGQGRYTVAIAMKSRVWSVAEMGQAGASGDPSATAPA
jgi:SAM-dependent methyltransferase